MRQRRRVPAVGGHQRHQQQQVLHPLVRPREAQQWPAEARRPGGRFLRGTRQRTLDPAGAARRDQPAEIRGVRTRLAPHRESGAREPLDQLLRGVRRKLVVVLEADVVDAGECRLARAEQDVELAALAVHLEVVAARDTREREQRVERGHRDVDRGGAGPAHRRRVHHRAARPEGERGGADGGADGDAQRLHALHGVASQVVDEQRVGVRRRLDGDDAGGTRAGCRQREGAERRADVDDRPSRLDRRAHPRVFAVEHDLLDHPGVERAAHTEALAAAQPQQRRRAVASVRAQERPRDFDGIGHAAGERGERAGVIAQCSEAHRDSAGARGGPAARRSVFRGRLCSSAHQRGAIGAARGWCAATR